MASEGEIILSYHDTLLRSSDVELLHGPRWLNDNIISFWFEYLEHELYKDAASICFISPQIAQFIKSAYSCNNVEDVTAMLESFDLGPKNLVLVPINDCDVNVNEAGGSHWSLLIYRADKRIFEHYDSHKASINSYHAHNVASVIYPLLKLENSEFNIVEMECTQQDNGYDCGVHVICNAEALCRKLFKRDSRHISEIASSTAIKQARSDILRLISTLRSKKQLEAE